MYKYIYMYMYRYMYMYQEYIGSKKKFVSCISNYRDSRICSSFLVDLYFDFFRCKA